ncbi:MAG: tetratricopeptide repeat protein, partial [bacterium]|nr:tetratricopeptide repeat protein [bacterium]
MRKQHWFLPALLVTVLVVALPVIGQSDNPEVLFEAAKKKKVVDGDLNAAIALYQDVVEKAGANRSLAASALVQLGECYERLGDTEARKAYERIVSEYSDQREQVMTAQAKLATMGAGNQQSAGVTIRKLEATKVTSWNVSADGRYLGATDYETGNAAIVDLVAGKHWNVTDYGNWSNENGYIDQSVISRDGKRIAFWHYKYSAVEGNLRVVGADGKGERVLLKGDDFNRGWGIPTDWSPDGKYVAVRLMGRSPNAAAERGGIDFALVPAD